MVIGFNKDEKKKEEAERLAKKKEEAEKLALRSFQKIIALRYFNKN